MNTHSPVTYPDLGTRLPTLTETSLPDLACLPAAGGATPVRYANLNNPLPPMLPHFEDDQALLAHCCALLKAQAGDDVERWQTLRAGLEGRLRPRAVFARFNDLCQLPDDWDGEGSPAPSKAVQQQAYTLLQRLEMAGQGVYTVAPGPWGEILIELRGSDERSLEILIYEAQQRFVKFGGGEPAQQGLFEPDSLSALLAWVKG